MTTAQDRANPQRPAPRDVGRVVLALAGTPGVIVGVPAVVATLMRETGCSRATAYRAVADAIAAGVMSYTPPRRRVGEPGA